MVKRDVQRVTRRPDGRWQSKADGATRAAGVFDTQSEAEESARATAKRQKRELVVHGKNGQIRKADSYGNDPMPPKDTEI